VIFNEEWCRDQIVERIWETVGDYLGDEVEIRKEWRGIVEQVFKEETERVAREENDE